MTEPGRPRHWALRRAVSGSSLDVVDGALVYIAPRNHPERGFRVPVGRGPGEAATLATVSFFLSGGRSPVRYVYLAVLDSQGSQLGQGILAGMQLGFHKPDLWWDPDRVTAVALVNGLRERQIDMADWNEEAVLAFPTLFPGERAGAVFTKWDGRLSSTIVIVAFVAVLAGAVQSDTPQRFVPLLLVLGGGIAFAAWVRARSRP